MKIELLNGECYLALNWKIAKTDPCGKYRLMWVKYILADLQSTKITLADWWGDETFYETNKMIGKEHLLSKCLI